jgi:hexosaminidase
LDFLPEALNKLQARMSKLPQSFTGILTILVFVFSCQNKPNVLNPEEIGLSWQLEQNQIFPEQRHQAKFTLTNKGNIPLSPDWEIYFNTIFLSVNPEELDSLVAIEHLSGDFFRIKPKIGFPILNPNESISFSYSSDNYLLKNSHVPSGLYITFEGKEEGFLIRNYSVSVLKIEDHLDAAAGSQLPIPSPDLLFEQNKNLTLLDRKDFSPIIPTPKSYEWGSGELLLNNGISIYADAGFEKEAAFLQERLSSVYTGKIEISSLTDASILIFVIKPMPMKKHMD